MCIAGRKICAPCVGVSECNPCRLVLGHADEVRATLAAGSCPLPLPLIDRCEQAYRAASRQVGVQPPAAKVSAQMNANCLFSPLTSYRACRCACGGKACARISGLSFYKQPL